MGFLVFFLYPVGLSAVFLQHRKSCPGLPLSGYGRIERRRRLQLGCHGRRYQWPALASHHDVAQSQQRGNPCQQFSVALPLGINAADTQGARGWSYPNIRQPLPYFCLTLRPGAREEQQLSLRKRRVAGLSRGGVRPARLCESQLQRPIHRLRFARFVLGAPPSRR